MSADGFVECFSDVFSVFVHSDLTNLPLNQLNAGEYTLRVWPLPSDSGK